MYLVATDDIAWILGRGHIAEEYAGDVVGCGGLRKRLVRRNRAGLLGLYTSTGG